MLPSPLSCPLLPQQSGDLPVFRKTLHLLLGKYELSVSDDLKHPTGGRDQLHLRAKRLFQFLFQPGSTRLIVSLCTIFNCDLHGFSINRDNFFNFYYNKFTIHIRHYQFVPNKKYIQKDAQLIHFSSIEQLTILQIVSYSIF